MKPDGLRTCQINTLCCFPIGIAIVFTCNDIKHCKMKDPRIFLSNIARNWNSDQMNGITRYAVQ